jgi:DNA-binding NtrC family response regulator
MKEVKMVNKILVIDDEEYIGWIIKKVFEVTDYEICLTLSGQQGLLEFERQNFDIVFLDLRLPDINGMEVLTKLKTIQKDIVVIIITAHGSIDTAIESMKKGAYDYITKPFDVNELLIQTQKAMEIVRLKEEVKYFRSQTIKNIEEEIVVSKNEKMNSIYNCVNQIADTAAAVLITGEKGSGKELIARRIHQLSSRSKEPFIVFNCGAIPESLVERDIFGFEDGFSSSQNQKQLGKLELATKGTIFFDDIEKLSLNVQVKLLNVLQEKEFKRVGGEFNLATDVRIIATTSENLLELIESGEFRADLYYKLNVVQIEVPPLRDRTEDIEALVYHFLKKYDTHKKIKDINTETIKLLKKYHWPGNIRELENVIERIVILNNDTYIRPASLPREIVTPQKKTKEPIIYFPENGLNLEDLEKQLIIKALKMSNENQSKAAQLLNITRSALIYRMQKYDIR